uniref:Uncharacterized protein n=1 Tax=Pseudomonas phage Cygsa01 TaxID=3138529 RepID=A0AAU6W3B0_9VIRU
MNALKLFKMHQEVSVGHLRACTAKFNDLPKATRDGLTELIMAAHKGYPLTKLIGYQGCTYARWFDEHGAMLEGMGYRVQLGAGSLVHPEAARVYCQIDREFVHDVVVAQQMQFIAQAQGDAVWL